MDFSLWSWPQWTLVALLALSMLINVAADGEPRRSKHSAGVALIEVVMWVFLLYSGGFFPHHV